MNTCTSRRCVPGLLVLALLCVLMLGCATPASSGSAPNTSASSSSVEAPRTFKEWLATGYALNASVRRTAAVALGAGRIDAGDAKRILADTDSTRSVLDEARKLEAVNPSTALGKVQYAVGVLRAGEKLLNDRGVK
jgi:ABC-type Fe3+-hydroxamate transport system substrate-binding protein